MASLKQKVIPLQFRTAKNREDFIVGSSNNEAIIWIDKYPSWQNDAFIIVGAKSSGKSHLCSVWQKKSKCLILDYNDVNIENKNAINSKNLAIENIEYIKNLKYLLHIINIKKEKGFKLLMTSGKQLSQLKFNLADLNSRLLAFPKANILLPTDDVLKGLIYKLFKDKGICVEVSVLNFLISRIERTYEAVNKIVEDMNNISLEKKKNITIPLAKEILNNYN